jgi:hypothetical protein
LHQQNNYWKLATELTDIRMSSVEKGFLQVQFYYLNKIYIETLMENNVFFTADTIENYNKTSLKSIPKNSTLEHSEVIDGVFL